MLALRSAASLLALFAIVCIRAAEPPAPSESILLWPEDDEPTTARGAAAGWAEVCREVELVYVPGEHHSSVSRHSCLVEIGQQIRLVLSRTATSKLEDLVS